MFLALGVSLAGRALREGGWTCDPVQIRDFATDKHRSVDDTPAGGGAGMVLKPEPVFAAMEQIQTPGCRRIYLTPDGIPLSPALALELSLRSPAQFAVAIPNQPHQLTLIPINHQIRCA